MHLIQGRDNAVSACLLTGPTMGTRVENEPRETETFTTLKVIDQGVNRLGPKLVIRRRRVDEIERVGKYGPDARFLDSLLEGCDVLIRQRLGDPAVRTLDKNL
jgi:hypothetical protein